MPAPKNPWWAACRCAGWCDGQAGSPSSSTRPGVVRTSTDVRRQRLRGPVPRRHRCNDRPLACAGGRRHGEPALTGHRHDAPRPRRPIEVGDELGDAVRAALWQFALTATDANRFVIRLAHELRVDQRSWCRTTAITAPSPSYIRLARRPSRARAGKSVRRSIRATTTRVVEFNDLPALEPRCPRRRGLVLAEPAMPTSASSLPTPAIRRCAAR